LRRGLADRHHVRVLEHRMGAVIRSIHDILVGPLEVERVVQRLAEPRILELLASSVEDPALPTRRRLVRNDIALDAAIFDSGELIAGRPETRGELLPEQIILARESLERDLAVSIEFPA